MATEHQQQRDWVRELARRVAEIAASAENHRRRLRWHDVNDLRRPDRAPILCRPVGAWPELLPPEELRCTDPFLRRLEEQFRRVLIKHDIGDDEPVEPDFAVSAVFDVDPPNTWGVDIGHRDPGVAGGAWGYDPPLKTAADLDRLRMPRYVYNPARTEAQLAQAHELLGDILPVRLVCAPPLSATLGNPAAALVGLTELMVNMIAEPARVHRLMAYLRDATLSAMRQVEATGLLTRNNTGAMTASRPFGPPPIDGRLTCQNLWCMANSQEFDQVSPAMWEEFCLEYQKPIFAQFGRVGYGCCENLTHKIDGVLSIPNLRIFVSSAWTDLDRVIEKVADRYVIMWRQKASDVVFPDDVSRIRRDLEAGLRKLRGLHVQIVLRELQTLAGHPDRLHVWTQLAKDIAAKYA